MIKHKDQRLLKVHLMISSVQHRNQLLCYFTLLLQSDKILRFWTREYSFVRQHQAVVVRWLCSKIAFSSIYFVCPVFLKMFSIRPYYFSNILKLKQYWRKHRYVYLIHYI